MGNKGPLRLRIGAVVTAMLDLPRDAFETDGQPDSFLWDDAQGTAQFEVTCLRGAQLRRHVCKALINIDGRRTAILRFVLNVVERRLGSPPVSPPSECGGEGLARLPADLPALPPGKRFHFFICHHQGSGGDQAHLLCKLLEDKGYRVWHDNSQRADQRNLQGMKKGVRESECLMIFLSGRKEKDGMPDRAGEYEGPFTRWFCHELRTKLAEGAR